MPVSKVGGYTWRRARANAARHLAQAAENTVLIRRAAHLQVARENATDTAVEIAAALASLNELVAIVEANERSDDA